MNFTAIFCCYILLPYFASLVSPPQEAITCNAHRYSAWMKNILSRRPQPPPPEEKSSEEKPATDENSYLYFFLQKLDHYHITETSQWLQKYIVNDQYYHGNGLVFLWIGTEEDVTFWRMQTGRWIAYCKKAKALCVGIYHRLYGPRPSINTENRIFKYANSEQALADVARFIYNFRDLKATDRKLPEKLKWVAYGRSRGGTLAIWLRMKYPHLVQATLSLGAPLLAKPEFGEFYKLIDDEMLDEERPFKDQITNAYKAINILIKKKDYRSLATKFKFCDSNVFDDDANIEKNTELMYLTFARAVASIMRYGDDVMKFVKTKAKYIMFGTKRKYKKLYMIDRFALLIQWVTKTNKRGCLKINYERVISEYKTAYDIHGLYNQPLPFGDRTNLHQSCYEFGQFETYDKFFGADNLLEFYTEFCNEVFEVQPTTGLLNRGVRKTNVFYGGLNIVVTNVIFVHGSRDPYRKLGIINENPGNSVTHILEGARHCDELDDFEVTPSLNTIKDKIYFQLMEWVKLSGKSEFIDNDGEKGNNAIVEGDEIVEGTGNTENNEKTEETANDGYGKIIELADGEQAAKNEETLNNGN